MRASAVEFVAPKKVEVTEVEVGPPGEHDVLVRTLYSGISAGTEMLAYRGEIDEEVALDETISSLSGTFAYPFRYGYSCVGRIEEPRGSGEVGSTVFAFHPHQELFVVPAAAVLPMEGVDPRLATLFPLVETALQISLDAGAVQEEHVVMLGLGAVGILAGALVSRAGGRVLASDPLEWRRRAAARFGIETLPPGPLAAAVRDATGGRGAGLVVEATGDPRVLSHALGLLAHEGTALVASWYGTKPASLPLGLDFHRRRLCIRSSQVSTIPARLQSRWTLPRRRAVARRLLEELPLEHLATHTFPVSRAADAFAAVDRGEEGLIHAALSYEPPAPPRG